jgi:hypothetical protein
MNWPMPLASGPADGAAQEHPVLTDQIPQLRIDRQQSFGLSPVGRVVVLAAEPISIDTRHVRHAGVKPGDHCVPS